MLYVPDTGIRPLQLLYSVFLGSVGGGPASSREDTTSVAVTDKFKHSQEASLLSSRQQSKSWELVPLQPHATVYIPNQAIHFPAQTSCKQCLHNSLLRSLDGTWLIFWCLTSLEGTPQRFCKNKAIILSKGEVTLLFHRRPKTTYGSKMAGFSTPTHEVSKFQNHIITKVPPNIWNKMVTIYHDKGSPRSISMVWGERVPALSLSFLICKASDIIHLMRFKKDNVCRGL